MSHVAVIGPHPTEFLHHLQAADYSHSQHTTYRQFTPKANHPSVAVSIHGTDASAGLESTEDVLKLLNANAILLLFAPSPALLQAVKKAIKTPVDLPKLKFKEGKPLIVHKIHGVDRYHLIPGFSVANEQGESPGDRASRLAKFCVDLIGKSVDFASDPAVVSQLTQDNLNPPSDANFVYRPAPISWYYDVGIDDDQKKRSCQWTVWLCSFATDYVPGDPECKVYTIMRFGGGGDLLYNPVEHIAGSVFPGQFSFNYQAAQWTTPWLWTHQEPQTYQAQVKDGYQYNVDYSQTFNLLKKAGTIPFSWTASYTEGFQQMYRQVPSEPNDWTRRFHVQLDDPFDQFVFRGLLVGYSSPSNLSFHFSLISYENQGHIIPIDVTFAD